MALVYHFHDHGVDKSTKLKYFNLEDCKPGKNVKIQARFFLQYCYSHMYIESLYGAYIS